MAGKWSELEAVRVSSRGMNLDFETLYLHIEFVRSSYGPWRHDMERGMKDVGSIENWGLELLGSQDSGFV